MQIEQESWCSTRCRGFWYGLVFHRFGLLGLDIGIHIIELLVLRGIGSAVWLFGIHWWGIGSEHVLVEVDWTACIYDLPRLYSDP